MLWENGRRSENVEDRRGIGVGGIAGGGVGVVVIALIAMFFGVDPRVILQEVGQGQAPSGQQQAVPVDPAQDKLKDFVSVVLADTEDIWGEIFQKGGAHYERPKLVLFTGAVRSACGTAQSAVGPFYCPGDHKVYIDLDFYRMLNSDSAPPANLPRPTSWLTRLAITYRTCSAFPQKCTLQWSAPPASAQTSYRCVRNCRPTAMRVSGRTMPTVPGISCRQGMWSRD